ncbi:hypothetical protein [Roseiflexus castenholzii]|uniref:hypothetical protein n=1 Tax=Roseiflexus castenholzii TaxID=120962 RepID=UPI003C7E6D94
MPQIPFIGRWGSCVRVVGRGAAVRPRQARGRALIAPSRRGRAWLRGVAAHPGRMATGASRAAPPGGRRA